MYKKTGLMILLFAISHISVAQEPVWDGNKVMLASEQVADNVFAIIPTDAKDKAPKGYPIATSGGFVIGDDAVLVVESMLNERLAKQVIALVKAKTNKPIKYLVNTSFHGDHSYGNYTFSPEATVIQHINAKEYVDHYFKQDTEFMMQNFGKGRGIEQVEPTTGNILVPKNGEVLIDLGGKIVEINDYGFAQTGGDLFISVKGENVLWTGNPVVSTKPALPWLLDGHLVETLATMRYVYGAMNDETIVIPGHGPVTDRSAIKWHIDYLTALRNEVRASIAQGLTLEQTQAAVTLPKFQGYALHGWVHSEMNVPAAYKELSVQK